jgi:hypothetical protein
MTVLGLHLPTEVNPIILVGSFLQLVVPESATSQAMIKIPACVVILPMYFLSSHNGALREAVSKTLRFLP